MRHLTAIITFALLSVPLVASAGPPARVGGEGTQPVIPEPSAVVVFALGVAVVGGAAWRQRKRD
jgi:hypothetical protein